MPHIQHLYSYFLHIHKSIRRESVGDISMGELQLIILRLQCNVFPNGLRLIKSERWKERKRAKSDSHCCILRIRIVEENYLFFSCIFTLHMYVDVGWIMSVIIVIEHKITRPCIFSLFRATQTHIIKRKEIYVNQITFNQ